MLHPDQTATVLGAATTRFSKEVWLAATTQLGPHIGMVKLRQAWEATVDKPPKRWATARGPAGIMYLECARVGWTMSETPFKILDDLKRPLVLTQLSTKKIQLELRQAVYRMRSRQLAKKLAEEGTPMSTKFASGAPARALLRDKKKPSGREQRDNCQLRSQCLLD